MDHGHGFDHVLGRKILRRKPDDTIEKKGKVKSTDSFVSRFRGKVAHWFDGNGLPLRQAEMNG